MSLPTSSTTSASLPLTKKLEILRFISDGHSNEEAAMRFDVDAVTVKRIVNTRTRLEKFLMQPKNLLISNLPIKSRFCTSSIPVIIPPRLLRSIGYIRGRCAESAKSGTICWNWKLMEVLLVFCDRCEQNIQMLNEMY